MLKLNINFGKKHNKRKKKEAQQKIGETKPSIIQSEEVD